jgi:drug/metabolite transporter (DMT)-like permease
MPLRALAFVIVAAFFHATWNFIIKKVSGRELVTWWAVMVGSLLLLPFVWPSLAMAATMWPYILSSALAEAIYFIALLRGYERADFSLIYPIGRGAAPALIACWSRLFIGEHAGTWGIAGIVLILLGLIVVGAGHTLFKRGSVPVNTKGVVLALFVAATISVYSVIDAVAVRMVPPLPYFTLVLSLTGLFIAPVVLIKNGHCAALEKWRTNFPHIILVAILNPLAYVLVLKAYAMAPVSYAGAIREVSIVLAAIAGWRWLGEDFGVIRVIGAVLIFSGIFVIALAG